ncbi:MAG: zinc ribbon domain-containing protein [Anaerolineae bacterium]|nr:MAG: zinc ribbon domain-containing protein [Anaerolineae bacterium]
MPNYLYICQDCGKRFSRFLTYDEYEKAVVQCAYCKSANVLRRIGRVRFARSEDSRMDSMADMGDLAGLDDDPKAMAKMFRQMSGEMGEDLGPEFNEVVDRLERGQSPEEIEKELPDLGLPGGDDFSDD